MLKFIIGFKNRHVSNPDFNYGEFAVIKSQDLNSYKVSVKEWVQKTDLGRMPIIF